MRRALLAAAAAAVVVAIVLVAFRAGGARVGTERVTVGRTSSSSESQSGSARATGPRVVVAGRERVVPTAARGDVVVRGGYGSGAREFGRRRDPESNPEAPMAIAAAAGGRLAVVDQVNRRIQLYQSGALAGSVAIGGDTVQDLALLRNGRLALLDRLADGNVQLYGADGKLANEIALAGSGVGDGGGITGLFADDDGVYVERDHGTVVRIADAEGRADPTHPRLVGRPSRDGRLLLGAEIADAAAGELLVRASDRATGRLAWTQPLHLGAPIVHIITLDSDAAGRVYLAADVGRESATAPFALVDEQILVARLGAGGAPRGVLSLPPLPTADESFRPIAVDDDGTVYVMAAGDEGLAVTRYVFP